MKLKIKLINIIKLLIVITFFFMAILSKEYLVIYCFIFIELFALLLLRRKYKLHKPKEVKKIDNINEPTVKIFIISIIYTVIFFAILLVAMYTFYLNPNLFSLFAFLSTTGSLIMFSGAFCHKGAIRLLQHRWVDGIVIQPGQALETKEWYSVVRHPVYLGNYLIITGFAFCFLGPFALLISYLYLFTAKNRAQKEELLLLKHMPSDFIKYKSITPQMIIPNPSLFFKWFKYEFMLWLYSNSE